MATIVPTFPTDESITVAVSRSNKIPLSVKRNLKGPLYELEFYGSTIQVVDQGDSPAKWFSDVLGVECRLAAILPGKHRRTPTGEKVDNSIFYGTPILAMSSETCDALSVSLGIPIRNDRFRSNIVFSGFGHPFEEDRISAISTRDWSLDGEELCIKCTYPGIDQLTGKFESKIVGRLRELRRIDKVEMHPKYRSASSKWEANDYLIGVYMRPHVTSDKETRIFVGQEIDCKY
jgi:uncharacterized protein YcbX